MIKKVARTDAIFGVGVPELLVDQRGMGVYASYDPVFPILLDATFRVDPMSYVGGMWRYWLCGWTVLECSRIGCLVWMDEAVKRRPTTRMSECGRHHPDPRSSR